jgi:hypothetical protein
MLIKRSVMSFAVLAIDSFVRLALWLEQHHVGMHNIAPSYCSTLILGSHLRISKLLLPISQLQF